MNIYEIAKKAKVSIATISRAVNPDTRNKVSPRTLAKIDALVRRYQYAPDLAAKNLSNHTYKTIGVILPHREGIFFSDYYSSILSGVADFLLESDHFFKMIMLRRDTKWDTHNFKATEGVDGLIITHWPNFFSTKFVLEKLGVPCVVINDPEKDVHVPFVSGANFLGGQLAAKHLYNNGHRKIAVITGPDWSGDSRLRVEGFCSFLKEAGLTLDPRFILCANYEEDTAGKVVETFLTKKLPVTAFFCCNDNMAFGTIKKIRAMGLDCPKDISVVGFDDDKRAEYFDPPLTTVHVPVYEIAKEATKNLLHRLKEKNNQKLFYGETLLPVSLIERQSVRKIK